MEGCSWHLLCREFLSCLLEKFFFFGAVGSGAASHVGFAATFSACDCGEFFDEVAGSVTCIVAVFSAEGSEVEFVAIIDDEEGGLGEVELLEAIHEFLQKMSWAFEGVNDVAGEASVFGEVCEEGVGSAGGAGGLRFLERFFSGDRCRFGGSEGGPKEGERLVRGDFDFGNSFDFESLKSFVGCFELYASLGDFFFK